mmetsp:Transcript_30514/g.29913  ORF Transcript_30514/g.29913 Transcript_30514/m.29913 type:complete len:115 (-) Transcript_30514:637-981(-)
MAIIETPFLNENEVGLRINDQGEEVEETKLAEDLFFTEFLNNKLEHYGALYIKYLRFREKVNTEVLAIDKKTLEMITDLQEEENAHEAWLQQQNTFINQDQAQLGEEELKEFQE